MCACVCVCGLIYGARTAATVCVRDFRNSFLELHFALGERYDFFGVGTYDDEILSKSVCVCMLLCG